jgi:hypothetical protein
VSALQTGSATLGASPSENRIAPNFCYDACLMRRDIALAAVPDEFRVVRLLACAVANRALLFVQV